MATSSKTLSSASETSKQKTAEANNSVFVSTLAQAFNLNNENRNQGSIHETAGSFLAQTFIKMNDTDRNLTLQFIKETPNIAKIFGYYLQRKITLIEDSEDDITRILRNSRHPKLAGQVPQEISDLVRNEITDLEEGNENVKRGMAEARSNMNRDSFR